MTRIAIVGAGAFGTSLAIYTHSLGYAVRVWCHEPDLPGIVKARGENVPYLSGCAVDPDIEFSNDVAQVLDGAGLVLIVCPSSHMRSVCELIAPHVPRDAVLASMTKGIENDTLYLMSDVQRETLPDHVARLAYLSGPSFARDIAAGLPTNLTCAADDPAVATRVQELLHSSRLRIYTSDDVVGVELGGAVKNVIAITCGASDGLGLGDSTRASLMTRGLAEITRLGVALGANPITFLGLAGVGDLMLTCTGDQSRNRTLGKRLVSGETAEQIVSSQKAVAEGYVTVRAVRALKEKLGIDMPIVEAVYRVCYQGADFRDEAETLSNRERKEEFEGILPRVSRNE
jgi:glycerol-3-phosphate dehydrogenase (NAD(P)+)